MVYGKRITGGSTMSKPSDDVKKKLEELRQRLFQDLPRSEIESLQLKVNALVSLGLMLDREHNHDQNTDHHDHAAFGDVPVTIGSDRPTVGEKAKNDK